MELIRHGGIVISPVASYQEGPGFDSWLGQDLSMWSLHVLPMSAGFSPGVTVSPTIKTCMLVPPPVSTLDQGTGLESGVGPQVLCCGCPLLFRDGLNAEN